MRIARHVLRTGIWVTFALLTAAAASAADTPDLRGRWGRNPQLSQDVVSKVFASLSLEGRGFSPDEQRFHDALLHFAKVIDSLQIEQTTEDVKIILAGDEVQIYYPERSHARQGVLGGRLEVLAHWRRDELIVQEKNEFGKLVQSLLNREGRLSVLVSLDDRRLREPLLLLTTYTAYDGKITLPQLLETPDCLHFKFNTLNGPAVQNKGMALFPRKINGQYIMLSRQDDENILLMFSDNLHFWQTPKLLLPPAQPWEFLKIGNCGSPIETEAGWLVLSNAVGAMRKYCLGAFLLDLNDPTRILGRLREPCCPRTKRSGKATFPTLFTPAVRCCIAANSSFLTR